MTGEIPSVKIAVAILNWNNKRFLELFLPSVVRYSSEAQIYLIDNASTDDSVEFVKRCYPEIIIIQHTQNEGFCKGYNLALAQIDSEYTILLNSDVEVTENWLTAPISFLNANPGVAACQPKIKSYNDKTQFEYAGAAGGFLDKFGFPFCRGRVFDTVEDDSGQYDDPIEIVWASGACMFIRTLLYKENDGLDEDFFAHMEEIDLCWRLINKGYKIYYTPESIVYHVGGGSLQKTNSYKTYLNFRNGLYLLYKNLPSNKLYATLFFRLNLDGIAAIRFLLKGKLSDFIAILKAHFHYYLALPSLYKKRKLIIPTKDKLETFSIVFEYFVKKKTKYSDYKP